jgi:hypothetical protein
MLPFVHSRDLIWRTGHVDSRPPLRIIPACPDPAGGLKNLTQGQPTVLCAAAAIAADQPFTMSGAPAQGFDADFGPGDEPT